MKLETDRLELVALTPRQLRMLTEDIYALEMELDVSYRAEPLEGFFLDLIKGQLKITESDPKSYMWHSFWLIIRKYDRVVVGSADFKDIPNAQGEVEIGYGLGSEFEHKGYMTETVAAMCQWALRQEGVSCIFAETDINSFASQRILTRCGFELCCQEATLWWRLRKTEDGQMAGKNAELSKSKL